MYICLVKTYNESYLGKRILETIEHQSEQHRVKTEHPLLEPITKLRGIGIALAEKLEKLKIVTILDLLLHLPYKYQDRTRITPISSLLVNSHAVIEGTVVDIKYSMTRAKKRSLAIYIQDATGIIELRFFQYNNNQLKQFQSYPVIRCFGEVKYGQKSLVIFHPEYQIINDEFINPVEDNLRPVYPSTEGVSQRRWIQLTDLALNYLKSISNPRDDSGSFDYLPKEILDQYNLLDFVSAIKVIHRPTPDVAMSILEGKLHRAQERLIFEELLAQKLAMGLAKQSQKKYRAPSLKENKLSDKLLNLLPFELTQAQHRVYKEISNDLDKSEPMSRLLQGDVGAGKTIIAALAMLQAVSSGYQVALMAPTEILATQHYHNLKKYFDILGVDSELLLSKQTKKTKINIKQRLENNELFIIIGTHALIQQDVIFNQLGLIIIDEQHRFGVEQRHTLWQKSKTDNQVAHQLTMTATPIPRTLAMTIYSDMDYSVIDELPPGRQPIKTVVISDQKRVDVINRIKSICAEGRQVYWVCTLIEESEVLTCQAAENSYEDLKELLSPLSIGLIHGRMKPDQKASIMQQFKDNQIKVLVATTVIEVGVDVPNASLMIIENPERLGLAQLHQLRGRVGRGSYESFCVLLYKHPLSEHAQYRLKVIRDNLDGFKLAEYDLKLRGSGELLGKRQTGGWNLKIADLARDKDKLPEVTKAVNLISKNYSSSVLPLVRLWLGDNYKLSKV